MTLSPTQIELPWPPTVNHYRTPLVIKGRARLIMSKQGRQYKDAVGKLCMGATKQTGRLSLTINAFPPDRRKRDLDNITKAILDGLTHGGIYDDDSQIDVLTINRGEVVKGGRIEIECREVVET